MEVTTETVLAPAKINLYLHLRGRRDDGYHLLDSVMLPVSLYDRLRISGAPADTVTVSVGTDLPTLPTGAANLAYRAATLLLTAVGRAAAVNVRLTKRIPVGSGLGGGSSDAAAVLLGVNRLLGSPLSASDLSRLAVQLGSDVPFFVQGRPARVGGAGETVIPLPDLPPLCLVLCSDGRALSTAEVYSRVRLPSLTSGEPVTNIADFVSGRKPISEVLVNDLEAAAAGLHPAVLSLKAKLAEQGAVGALMTGSGSAVFGVWPDLQSARHAADRLSRQGLWAEAVRTLTVSPAVES